jgi:Ca2+-binding EF-hand superfamily protein
MSNCTDVQQLPQYLQLGNLYAGITCPEKEMSLMNCPLGSYCPTPEAILPCPAGSYCPHKSDQPWITCSRCEEGSLELKRDAFGYVFFSFVVVVLLLTSCVLKRREYQSKVFAKQLELLARQADSLNVSKRRNVRQEQLERLKPKLDILARRLERRRPPRMARSPASQSTTHSTIFDTRKLYDLLDNDGNGKISYQELNAVLELNQHELQNFVRRMRELGQMDDDTINNDESEDYYYNHHRNQEDTVSRAVFVKHFIQVLDETSQLSVTPQEAAALWDQMEADNGSKGYVDESMLYTSPIATFLDDRQIYVLIKVCWIVQDGL